MRNDEIQTEELKANKAKSLNPESDGSKSINLEPSWLSAVGREFTEPYMKALKGFLAQEIKRKNRVYPKPNEYFKAFELTPVDKVKVVILGQDPYHGPGQAHGLCFSVLPEVEPPPSLVNIFKELEGDLNIKRPNHGFLVHWAEQGVLLLNATLSVRAGQAGSHQNQGWEQFTDKCIEYLSSRCENIVFMLWGSYAQKKGACIDEKKHLVLKAPHPSPLSAYRGFLGCKHFSKANEYLKEHNREPIDWSLPELSAHDSLRVKSSVIMGSNY